MRIEVVATLLLSIALVGEVLSLYALVKISSKSSKEWVRVFTIVGTAVLGTFVGLTVLMFIMSLFGAQSIIVTTSGV
jgi:hypothetical protein